MRLVFVLILPFLLLSHSGRADEIRPALLQLVELEPQVFEVLWKVPARNDNMRLSLDVQFDDQVTRLTQPHGAFVGAAYLQTWMISRSAGLSGMSLSIAGLARSNVEALLRIQYLDGRLLVNRLTPESPQYRVVQQPSLGSVISTYWMLGVEHILMGVDHLLFVLVMMLLVTQFQKLVWTITAFTIAHSITLSLAALNLIYVPVPPVEACIALSIVFVATEIIRAQHGRSSIAERKPWIVAFTFGLLHGLGFAAALGEIGLPQTDIPAALLCFNLGVEFGQLLFVLTLLSAVVVLKRARLQLSGSYRHWPAYFIGSVAAFWTIERTAAYWV